MGYVRKDIFLILIALSSTFLVSTSLLDVRSVAAASVSAPAIHDGIAIHSDEKFTTANGVVSGSGILADPYVIENWDIEIPAYSVPVVFPSGQLQAGILIANTTAHVNVRHVQVHGPWPGFYSLGIVLWNATNVLVEHSTVWNANTGVFVIGTRNSGVRSNEFYNLDHGVSIGRDPNSGIIAGKNFVEDNEIHDIRTSGLNLANSSDNTIRGNTVFRATWGAYMGQASSHNIFSDNLVTGSKVGIEIVDSSLKNTIRGNTFEVEILGIGLGFGSNGTLVYGNEVHSLQWGINLIEVSGSEVSRNHVQARDIGINLLRAATMNTITGNVVTAHIGIFVCNADHNRLAPPPNDLRASDRPIEHCH